MNTFDVEKFRSNFPLLKNKLNGSDLIYFDNAATTHKPQCVIDTYNTYYQQYNSNVHRASHQLSSLSTAAFEKARNTVKKFINARSTKEVIWTKGTTESVNLLANSLGHLILNAGDEIILTHSEHHANIVPWQIMAQSKSVIIKIAPLTDEGVIDTEALSLLISSKTKIISFAHISNVIGKINPINEIVKQCKSNHIISIIDGAQAIAHEVIDVQSIDCDFYLFSAHKMYGPTGVGVLYGKQELLERMPPYQGGGEMISKVSFSQTTYNTLPFKFEAGTPNIAGVIAFSSAITFISQIGMTALITYENSLVDYCYCKLNEISEVCFITKGAPSIPLFSFTLENQHNHDVASFLDAHNIAVRAGHHCAMPLMEYVNIDGCIRIALTAYNTMAEIDILISVLNRLLSNLTTDKKTVAENLHANNSQFIIDTFSALKGWDSRHREIMLLGKSHARMAKELLNDKNLIEGCESKAWLMYKNTNGVYEFTADSDAKVIRGLLVIVLAAYNNQCAEYIRQFDINAYFYKLGLINHLSPSRANGLLAIVNRIKTIVND